MIYYCLQYKHVLIMDRITPFQTEIVRECIQKRRGCLCVPMGTGKTLIGLSIINRIGDSMPALVVCSKTLIGSWVYEIQKFFGEKMVYAVYHKDYMPDGEFDEYTPLAGTDVVLTTPDVLMKAYNEHSIHDKFVTSTLEERGGFMPVKVNRYNIPLKPFLGLKTALKYNNAFLYNIPWKCILVDELQQYTNIYTKKCEAICSVFARYRWGTTGTPISEPKIERLVGYHYIIGDTSFPTCVPDANRYITSDYTGLLETMVIRYQADLDFVLPECTEQIISHSLTREECAIYTSLKEVIKTLRNIVMKSKDKNPGIIRSINAQFLAMILYTRQFLVNPIGPYNSLMKKKLTNEMTESFKDEIMKRNIVNLLKENPKSSRINAIIDVLNKHPDERCIVFSCFRTNLDLMKKIVPDETGGRKVFTIKSQYTSQERVELVKRFESTSNGILFLTYELGAEGLNLQRSRIMLLADVWWNDSKTSQAVARVLRRGQTQKVFVYLFTSNTGIEKSLYAKHIDKKEAIGFLMVGRMRGKIRKITMTDLIELILKEEENINMLADARR